MISRCHRKDWSLTLDQRDTLDSARSGDQMVLGVKDRVDWQGGKAGDLASGTRSG